MTNAGTINAEWYTNALSNGSANEVCEWFATAINAVEVEIDEELSVAADGRWLSQEQIDAACEAIDAGF
jgi:hypothetical protein